MHLCLPPSATTVMYVCTHTCWWYVRSLLDPATSNPALMGSERNDQNKVRAEAQPPHTVLERMDESIMDRLLLMCH
jgi:hypothetical protein